MLRELFLDALLSVGCGVLQAIELWNVTYWPEIKALPPGRYKYNIGKHEITFKKVKRS